MGMLWVILFTALTGLHLVQGLPVRPTPQVYPHGTNEATVFQWGSQSLYTLPALALVLTAIGLLFGCTWCYRHKDCKLFTASASHIQDVRRVQPDSGFAEPANNNISEDNNNGPISLREMQNIANNNAAAYIVSENEERNRISRESVVEFEPLPVGLRVVDPLERCADWFGDEDFPRNRLQYLREIGRGWFGRVVEGELEGNTSGTVAVKILNQNANLEEKARFLDEAKIYRDARHENILSYVAKCLQEDPWILLFELCSMDLQQYLILNRPKMAILNESGVPLQLMCDVTSALAYLHSRGILYGELWSGAVLVRGSEARARAVLGQYVAGQRAAAHAAPERRRHPPEYTSNSEVWSLGTLIWEICAWGSQPPTPPPPLPDLPCPYRTHLYQVMQLCWNPNPDGRPSAAQVHALLNHLHSTHIHSETAQDDGYGSSDFEERWQRLKPNSIPKIDEHVAIVHAPSTSMTSHFTGSDQEFDSAPTMQDTLSVDLDTAVSRSSSIMSDKDSLPIQMKSESLNNLHGSLDDVRNIYLTHNETAAIECHQGNVSLDDTKDKDNDHSDSSMDPWLKDIITGSQDDVSYYKDVSDVIKNLDNILNSEKTSSSESSHQASPSRDNLSLECKKDYPVQKSMVKSPGISNFQNILEIGFDTEAQQDEACEDDDVDRDTIGTLSHSFERHSDSISQHTLENLTPETPIKDLDVIKGIEVEPEPMHKHVNKQDNIIVDIKKHSELPNDNKVDHSISHIPMLKELCEAAMPSVSETIDQQLNVREDCHTPCDNKLTDVKIDFNDVGCKSVDDVTLLVESEEKSNTESATLALITEMESTQKIDSEIQNQKSNVQILPESENKIATVTNKEDVTTLVINDMCNESKKDEIRLDHSIHEKFNIDFEVEEHNGENTFLNIKISPKAVTRTREECNIVGFDQIYEDDKLQPAFKSKETPEIVQNLVDSTNFQINNANFVSNEIENIERTQAEQTFPPELVQNNIKEFVFNDDAQLEENVNDLTVKTNDIKPLRSDINVKVIDNVIKESQSDSTVYMDLTNDTNNEFCKDNNIYSANVVPTYFESSKVENETDNGSDIFKNESTAYLDLPSVIKETDNFLHSERILCSQTTYFKDLISSTPKGSDSSVDALETSAIENEYDVLSETKVPECDPGVTLTKLEQICVPDNLSPLESPTKSHHTDTYDENSSVVLGPFENCTLELFKAVKSEIVDLPKEELLAFSSNFSEIDLETPSPLRDGNFLNEVPDIVHDDLHFDDVVTVSETKPDSIEGQSDNTENTEEKSNTEKHISPSTPPNSPGVFLASTSQQKYLVDIDLSTPNESVPHTSASKVTDSLAPQPSDSGLSSLQKEIDLNQIELQITTKLAMAENENNLNIEYSGPLTVEGFVTEDEMLMRESDAIPESYLAGNGRTLEDFRDLTLDEECVQALRNELELKLPLAQVAGIEPAGDTSGEEEVVGGEAAVASASAWGAELPPPPELLLSYPPALSPIAEETGQQLSAYENDTNWNLSNRTESSESYPEPCNNSTDEVTDLLTGVQSGPHEHSTYTIKSRENSLNNTYTVQREIGSSKEITMSADSLNASPFKKLKDEPLSPIDDKTYNKNDDEKLSNCERLSQVSPFLLSPTTDTSAPDNSDNNAGCSTLSKPTVPTDAKSSKPSETQCLSKATSIDSWCSNDTLYNVEENFDDLAMDPDMPLDFEPDHEPQKDDKSESTDTLTHNEEEKELSHCSTYIIHDSKSDMCETFSPDSITANDNNTYTKAKTDAAGLTPSVNTKSELNDSTKNTQTKDLAYGTLMSGLPSNSNCTTEVLSIADEVWKLTQPELVRRSPCKDDFNFTPPNHVSDKECSESSPKTTEPKVNRMDSVEVTCLKDNSDSEIKSEFESQGLLVEINDSQDYHYRNMAHSVTSTPLAEIGVDNDNVECIPIKLPEITTENSEYLMNNLPNFQTFLQSAEIRPQDISSNMSNEGASSNQDTEILLEGESKSLSRNSNKDSLAVCDRTPTYADFENSATSKPQDLQSRENTTSFESSTNSDNFRGFENSVRSRPQDLSSLIDASSLLLKSERRSSELAMESISNLDRTNRSGNLVNNVDTQSLVISPPNTINLNESHIKDINRSIDIFITDLDMEEETEQPHSIIITESPLLRCKNQSPNITYDSHTVNMTYNSHEGSLQPSNKENTHKAVSSTPKVNGDETHIILNEHTQSPEPDISNDITGDIVPKAAFPLMDHQTVKSDSSQGRVKRDVQNIKCNGDSQKYATVSFLNESFEELLESNVDDNDSRDFENDLVNKEQQDLDSNTETVVASVKDKVSEAPEEHTPEHIYENIKRDEKVTNGISDVENEKITSVTDNFLQNEKKFCQLDSYLPLLSDIRFTGPGTETMSTAFNQESPTEPTSPECEQDSKPDTATEILKEWESDSDSHSTNSSSGEFIWKQREGGSQANERPELSGSAGNASSGSEGSEGSEGDEVEFVPSSWDCRAAPAKSSLRSLEQAAPDNKKRVVFKRQKYHCVYEYPREVADVDAESPAFLPDFSTYSEWDPTSAEDAEIGYGELFGAPNPLNLFPRWHGPGADYDEDFFISSSARPFESLGVMSTTSQFFPGMHVKPSLLERDIDDLDDFPPPPSPLPPTTLVQTRTPSLDFTTPDSGVEDITPGSTSTEDDFKTKKISENETCWRPVDSASSSESVSPSSPGGEALGGLRHTRDKLKLDLPPSPHIPSPRHNRVFNFVLDKPKRRSQEERTEIGTTPLVMTDETPIITTSLPLQKESDDVIPEPTFSTFGKCASKNTEPEQKAMILTDDIEESEIKEESSNQKVEPVKGEGTVLDSGDEDSGIESSSKATLERNKSTPNVS